jgi:exopolysaccharide biosynthesis WecB/TagA/CpsF family protein
LASLAICASGATIRSASIGKLLVLETGWAAWPLSIFWIVMITVCMNLIDGLDGLAGGIAGIVCGTLAVLALWTGQTAMAVLMLALLGSVTGFLFFNFYPARIFMGDCGSMFLGFLIGAGSLVCQTKTTTMVGLAIPFLVMGVPILDASFVLVGRRVLERRSLFSPDRRHLHHRMLDRGLQHRTVVIIIYAITAISACIGMLMLIGDGTHSVGLMTGGLLFLLSVFAWVHGGRFCRIVKALRRNWDIAREAKAERRSFESAQLKMRECTSFGEWWQTICDMATEMNFHSIGLWDCLPGTYVDQYRWRATEGKFPDGRLLQLQLPLRGNGNSECELRASVWANGYLEISGRQGMLLSRLIDDFPPPKRDEEIRTLWQFSSPMNRRDADREVDYSIEAVSNTRVPEKWTPAQAPAPLDVMGIPVVPFESYDQALRCIDEIVESGSKSFWVAINPIKICRTWKDPELLALLKIADVGVCDGIGVSVASRLLNGHSIKRCTGCDMFFKLTERASQKGWGVYLLGASAKSNAAARSRLTKSYPDLRIVGWHDGYFEDSKAIIDQINASRADLLFVAMGSPRQERWIGEHRHSIDARFCMGVGGSFDVAAGNLRRAPRIFRMTGTEFLFRLMMEPRKRGRIQKVLVPYFLAVLARKLADFLRREDDRGSEVLNVAEPVQTEKTEKAITSKQN